MAEIDTEREWRRLTSLYEEMSDEELLQLAEGVAQLTDLAQDAIGRELARRNLQLPPAPSESEKAEEAAHELVTIRQFRDMSEALLAQGCLSSAGIDCFIGDENMIRLNWFASNALGGIKLNVRKEDEAVAEAILADPPASDPA